MKNNTNSDTKKNNNNHPQMLDNQLLNLLKFKIHPPPIGQIYENPNINKNLNFSTLEPILSKGKRTLVGDGSFSKVFLYQHRISKIKYAVKKINIPSFINKTNNKNLIYEEINIQSKILHPNIIRLFNYFNDKKNVNMFLILEYASKGTLFDYIHNKKGLNEPEAFYFFIQAVNSISFLHKNKIIHRDIKPENLLINNNNILKLCDFGWSVYLNNNNKRVTFCGTVEYMAPEIVKNESYDFSIDVWSLGVLLYELIHSHSPFVVKDLNVNKIENNILSKELKFKKGVSLECRDLIEKLLIKDANERIKIDDIYKHPFILKYTNMMDKYIISKNKLKNDNDIFFEKEKNDENFKPAKVDEIRESFSEFDTIPSEPKPAKILVNFDKIVRKFTKIDNIIKSKNENKDNIKNAKSIKNIMSTKMIKEKGHKKSLSLNNDIFEKSIIKSFNNEQKEKCVHKNILESRENKIINLNKENLLKLIIKNTKSENPDIKHKKFLKKTLIEEYNAHLNKNNNKKDKSQINKNKILKLNLNSSCSKNLLINSYTSKNNKNIFNQKILGNLTDKNISNKTKLDKSSKMNIKNCKSISFFKNIKNNNLYNDYLTNSNINSYKKTNSKNVFKIKTKKNILTKKVCSLNKSKNYTTFNILKKPRSKETFRNKFTLNLSNINVYNFCNSGSGLENSNSFNDSKYFQQINNFIFVNKGKEIKGQNSENKKKFRNNPLTDRLKRSENSKIFISLYRKCKSNMNIKNTNSNKNNNIKKSKNNLIIKK